MSPCRHALVAPCAKKFGTWTDIVQATARQGGRHVVSMPSGDAAAGPWAGRIATVCTVAILGLTAMTLQWPTSPAGAQSSSGVAAPPGTEPAVATVSGIPPVGAVPIDTDEDAQTLVTRFPPGTAFVISTGTHLAFTVIPQQGDTFYAQAGAVLDGENLEASAFRVSPKGVIDDVQIIGSSAAQPLVIEDYGRKSHSQIGAIQTNYQSPAGAVYASGWRLQWLRITLSAARGVSLSNNMIVIGCQIISNGRLGIGGGGSAVTIADNSIAENGLHVGQLGWEAGGIKTVADDVLIEGNHITDNGAAGIWTDVGASDIAVDSNQISGNYYGAEFEISRDVTLSGNTITASKQQAVVVVASLRVAITDNSIGHNFRGIVVGGSRRTGPDGIHLDNVSVSHNSVVDSGTSGLHQPITPGIVIHFDWDHYVGERFQWNGESVSFSGLQAMGQERHGTSTS
jgi:parallel beta-helix repeat protein